MDLTFNRYADPFLFFDTLLDTGQFARGVDKIFDICQEEMAYRFYLHKDYENRTYEQFKSDLLAEKTKQRKSAPQEVVATIQASQKILEDFALHES